MTKTQFVILSVIRDILHHEDILNIKTGKRTESNEPGLWRLYLEKLIDKCKGKNYIYPRSQAIKLFDEYYSQIYDQQGNSPRLPENQCGEIGVIDNLIKLYQHWITKSKKEEKRGSDAKNLLPVMEVANTSEHEADHDSSDDDSNCYKSALIEKDAKLALDYLCRAGEILSFDKYKKYLFPCPKALINTCKVFLDHKEDFSMKNENTLNN